MSKKLFHWRNESGELDVFEAANYFAGSNDHHQVSNCHKLLRQGCNNQAWRSSGRMSLDMPPVPAIKLSSTPFGTSSQMEKPAVSAMKGKIPSSPGGKLASFLNSLFNQKTSSKKKKKQKLNSNDNEDSQTPSGWIRRRRSSLSELYAKRSSSNTTVSASSNSGFRTPPPYPKNSSCKDNHNPESMFKFISSGISSERRTMMMTSVHHWADEYPSEEHEERKFEDDYDQGTDSDSSSDLFDLPNRELLDCYSTGLPVYQTTQMNAINSSNAPISATVI
ncbi:PREDICTED: protein BIG GRAIN 1-like E isoform X2 [Ipomoea nil]|uniref:protein BIG GRAIN 1-like E isoform X2 n=1 Tax=Ipomoea nil TaxID=35883 RepID=UPI000900961A|nr:PREDICTED: protein BIG GRAIN 1-like E isoform X2 [Ipomoea nil]